MATAIIYAGHLGSTKKAAEIIARRLGKTDIYNAEGRALPDLEPYENVIFGCNVRMNRLNSKTVRKAKRLKKQLYGKKVYCYILCCREENEEFYIEKAMRKIPGAIKCVCLGGVLDSSVAPWTTRKVIDSLLEDYRRLGKPAPRLDKEKTERFADEIKNYSVELNG